MVQPETVGPLFIFSFDSSTVRAGGKHEYPTVGPQPTMATYRNNHDDNNAFHPRRSDSDTKHHKAVNQCQEESARPHANSKKTKPHSSANARRSMQSAGSAECQSTIQHRRTPPMIHLISITCSRSASIPSSNSTQQASDQATPAATDSEATKTHQPQSAH